MGPSSLTTQFPHLERGGDKRTLALGRLCGSVQSGVSSTWHQSGARAEAQVISHMPIPPSLSTGSYTSVPPATLGSKGGARGDDHCAFSILRVARRGRRRRGDEGGDRGREGGSSGVFMTLKARLLQSQSTFRSGDSRPTLRPSLCSDRAQREALTSPGSHSRA